VPMERWSAVHESANMKKERTRIEISVACFDKLNVCGTVMSESGEKYAKSPAS